MGGEKLVGPPAVNACQSKKEGSAHLLIEVQPEKKEIVRPERPLF